MPSVAELIEKLRKGQLSPEDLLKYVPDPPKMAPTLNRIIDRAIHPLAEKNKALYLLDSALHIFVETGDALAESLAKTVRYNLPKILKKKKS